MDECQHLPAEAWLAHPVSDLSLHVSGKMCSDTNHSGIVSTEILVWRKYDGATMLFHKLSEEVSQAFVRDHSPTDGKCRDACLGYRFVELADHGVKHSLLKRAGNLA